MNTLMSIAYIIIFMVVVVFAAVLGVAVAVFLRSIAVEPTEKTRGYYEEVNIPVEKEEKRLSDAFGKAMTYNDFIDDEDYKHALIAKAFYDADQ